MATITSIHWIENLEQVSSRAKQTGLPQLLFLHSHHCGGCRKTLAETVIDPRVVHEITSRVVPGLFEISEQPQVAQRYNLEWTPTFIIADPDGKELYRWVGFLSVDEFLPQFLLSLGRAAFTQGDFEQTEQYCEQVLSEFPTAVVAPEARYWQGVSIYKRTNDNAALVQTNLDLERLYPDSIWAQKASVWTE